ncbi:DUF2190 family protein [Azospirillum sp. TSO5]|uniref:DUF2190 family protein n=1 Tax=Azospirillum sp. TSO5 TaxID=716760 RepID=UPI000D60BB71|nr:DUF2190 family protein [Azospirillum sp. TSO5]PWC98044.1 hypothetical protein TSO5_03310 [Azospirillum sp. TSO5]
MSTTSEFKVGDKVTFRPSGRATTKVTATITATVAGANGAFLKTKDASDKERLVRPGACTKTR